MSLAWRSSCRMGVCGSCGMLINGRAMLACNTQILDISSSALTISALPNFNIIRDLVPDLSSQFEKHARIEPMIIREDEKEMRNPTYEFYQGPEDLTAFLQFTFCIKCGCCMAACPTMADDPQFLGPQPLAQAYRYCADNRDEGFHQRKDVVAAPHGIFSCHYGSECSTVCPKGVDPARAIQFMKRLMVKDYFRLMKPKKGSSVTGPDTSAKRNDKIPYPPEYTVEQKKD